MGHCAFEIEAYVLLEFYHPAVCFRRTINIMDDYLMGRSGACNGYLWLKPRNMPSGVELTPELWAWCDENDE